MKRHCRGEVSERLKEIASKGSVGEILPWVRIPPSPPSLQGVRPGDIGDRSYRRHRLHFWAKRVVERLQSFFLQIDVAEIVLHKADQPNTFFDFFDPQGLSCEDRAEINFFAVQTDASAVGDVNDAGVKRISK